MASVKDKLEQLKSNRAPDAAPPEAGGLQAGGKAPVPASGPPQPASVIPAPPDNLSGGAAQVPGVPAAGTAVPPKEAKAAPPAAEKLPAALAQQSKSPAPASASKPESAASPAKPAAEKKPPAAPSKPSPPKTAEPQKTPTPTPKPKPAAPPEKPEKFDPTSMQLKATGKCYQVPVDQLYDFPGHPFSVDYNDEMKLLETKILRDGVQEPILLWPNAGKLYIVSGHRRRYICQNNGITHIPAIIREMTRDEATIAMTNGNEHREKIPFTQRIKAYAMEMEAQKRQGARNDLTSRQNNGRSVKKPEELADVYGKRLNVSGRTFQRYLHLIDLSKDFCCMIDAGEMKAPIGVELSYLTAEQQTEVFNIGLDYDVVPSPAQAKQLHELSESGKWKTKDVKDILVSKLKEKDREPEEPPQKPVVFQSERIPLMFPEGTENEKMEAHILKMLEIHKLAQRQKAEQAKEGEPGKAAPSPPPLKASEPAVPSKPAADKAVSKPAIPGPEKAAQPTPTPKTASDMALVSEKPVLSEQQPPAKTDSKILALPPTAKKPDGKAKKQPTR